MPGSARRWTLLATLFASLPWGSALAQGLAIETRLLASGLEQPLGVVHAGDGSGRLFLVQQSGEILIWDGDSVLATPFLDLRARVSCCGEKGLLGLAFHPGYESNGFFYVAYTEAAPNAAGQHDVIVARYQASADPDVADADSELRLLAVFQPFGNHNGGHLAFDRDGYLYLSSGDGGSGGDPGNRGQSLDTLLGKLLRIDVDNPDPGRHYGIPPSNPFAADAPAGCSHSCAAPPCGSTCDEIWAFGVRNPWRFSFDRLTDDLYFGDAGQQAWEEVDFQPAASAGGENYGWRIMEGSHCYPPDPTESCTPPPAHVPPVLEYPHDPPGCYSVTGGYVYRGSDWPRLDGVYLYADFCSGIIWGTVPRCDGAWESRELADTPFSIASFGEDEVGDLLVAELTGEVHRLGLAPTSGGPLLEVSPSPIDFGAPPGGSLEVTLHNANAGPEAVQIAALSLSLGADFALDVDGGSDPCGSAAPCLAPGDSCTVEVIFSGSGAAWFLDSLATPSNSALRAVAVGGCSAPAELDVVHTTVTGETRTFDACRTLRTGPGFSVAADGVAVLRAGERVELGSGATIAGSLEVYAGLP